MEDLRLDIWNLGFEFYKSKSEGFGHGLPDLGFGYIGSFFRYADLSANISADSPIEIVRHVDHRCRCQVSDTEAGHADMPVNTRTVSKF